MPMPMPGQTGTQPLGIIGETNTLRLTARGPWVCISPWNFPLAIFVGQAAAALVTGKPRLLRASGATYNV